MTDTQADTAALTGTLWPFRYHASPLYGGLVQLGADWPALVAERGLSKAAASLLGESLCTVALLAGSAKNPPCLTLQLSGAAGVELLVAQSLHPGQLRGMVKPKNLAEPPFGKGGRLVLTLERDRRSAQPAEAAQSIVPLDGQGMAEAMQEYFIQSEQLATRFYIYADAQKAFGIMVQRVAGDDSDVSEPLSVLERWALRDLPPEPEKFLGALLEHDIELVQPTQTWAIQCHCDSGSVGRMLLGLGRDEAQKIVTERGKIDIECGYCGAEYVYDAARVDQLFSAAEDAPPAARN